MPKPEHIAIAPDGLDHWREAFRIVQAFETWQSFGDFVTEKHPRFGPGVAERLQAAATVTAGRPDAARAIQAASPRGTSARWSRPAP